MNNDSKRNWIIAVLFIIILILLWFVFFRGPKEIPPEAEGPRRMRGGPCPGETVVLTQKDPYMKGILNPGEKFKVIMNYYDCNPVQRNDLVYYQISTTLEPVVKIVRGIPGDTFKVVKDTKMKAWNLLINDQMMKSFLDGSNYFFGGESKPTLTLYERSHNNKILQNEVLLLSSWPPGDKDSALFGIFNIVDVVGKVEKVEGGAEPSSNFKTGQ